MKIAVKLLLLSLVCSSSTAVAGKSKVCCPTPCTPAACAPRAEWYKAKDGSLREKPEYWAAVSRAEDADDMEIVLRGVQQELVAANAEI